MLSHFMRNLLIVLILATTLSGCGETSEGDKPQDHRSWQLLDENHGINGSAWQLAQCDGCHLIADIHASQPQIKTIVRTKGYQSCVGCHGSNGTPLQRPCLLCHNDIDLPGKLIVTGSNSHDFNPNTIDLLSDKDCQSCHVASNMDGQFDVNVDLTRFTDSQQQPSLYQDSSEFCLRCHNEDSQQPGYEILGKGYQNPLIAMKTNYSAIDFHGDVNGSGDRTFSGLRAGYRYQQRVQCIDCHAMHGTHNQQLIIGNSRIGAKNLTEDQLPGTKAISVTTHQGDSSQLCVLCHQMTEVVDDGAIDTGNGLAGVHLTGQECRSCHQHGMATQTGL